MGIHSINHVQLPYPVGAEEQIRNFYGNLVGLKEYRVGYPAPQSARLRFLAGAQRLDFAPHEVEESVRPGTHLAFEVQDLPGLRNRFLKANVPLEESQALPGYLRFYVLDPAGNQLEFLEVDGEQRYSE